MSRSRRFRSAFISAGPLISEGGILFEGLGDHPFEPFRHVGVEPQRRNSRPVQDGINRLDGALAAEGQRAGDHFVEDDPERKEIAPAVERPAARLFGRHVVHGAHRRSRGRDAPGVGCRRLSRAWRRGRLLGELGQAEVEELGLAPFGDEDVGRLDVPVDDPRPVGRLERIGDLRPDGQGAIDGQRPALQLFLERSSLHELHDDKRHAALVAEVVDRADVRVVQGGRGPGLAPEPLERLAGVSCLLGEELDRDVTAEADVFRLKHDAHPAAAEFRKDAVMGKDLADRG